MPDARLRDAKGRIMPLPVLERITVVDTQGAVWIIDPAGITHIGVAGAVKEGPIWSILRRDGERIDIWEWEGRRTIILAAHSEFLRGMKGETPMGSGDPAVGTG